jgi:hypothetical protein
MKLITSAREEFLLGRGVNVENAMAMAAPAAHPATINVSEFIFRVPIFPSEATRQIPKTVSVKDVIMREVFCPVLDPRRATNTGYAPDITMVMVVEPISRAR